MFDRQHGAIPHRGHSALERRAPERGIQIEAGDACSRRSDFRGYFCAVREHASVANPRSVEEQRPFILHKQALEQTKGFSRNKFAADLLPWKTPGVEQEDLRAIFCG